MKDINDNSYNLYWIRKGSQSVYSEVEEENVGKDEIELSGYIGENISQIDQNIKFTIENEVDAGKFKQMIMFVLLVIRTIALERLI